jgi:hypothetical protein
MEINTDDDTASSPSEEIIGAWCVHCMQKIAAKQPQHACMAVRTQKLMVAYLTFFCPPKASGRAAHIP